MRRLSLLFFISFAMSHSMIAQGAMDVAAAFDWGTIRVPKVGYVETDLRIRNVAATGVLHILEIKPGCGCTTAEPDKRDIAPGEEATVHIKLNIGASQSGQLQKSVTIRSVHGTDTLAKVVMLKVDVARMVVVQPAGYIAFNDATVGRESVTTLTITNPSAKPVTLTKLSVDGGLSVDLRDNAMIAPSASTTVTVRFTPEKVGQFSGTLRFTASGNGDDEEMILMSYGMANPAAPK